MHGDMWILMMAGTVVWLVSAAYAYEGTATFYNPPYVPSACNGYRNSGELVAAASNSMSNRQKVCGNTFVVKCTGGTNLAPNPCKPFSVNITIVDYCPACHSTINLSREAFSAIADPNAGKIKIHYENHV